MLSTGPVYVIYVQPELRHPKGGIMIKNAFAQSVVVAALALLWASPVMAQTPASPGPGFPATSFLAPTKAT
jgi:hypothetical protein